MLNGARRLRRETPQKKRALTIDQLWRMSRVLDIGTARGLRDRAVLALGFSGAFRRSELASMDVADVTFVPKGLLVTLRWSKTDQEGRGRLVGVFRAERADICPVRTLKAWLDRRGNRPGPLFLIISGTDHITDQRLGPFGIVQVIKQAAACIELDSHQYAGHSLRSGYCTEAARNGATEMSIMARTGHRSVQMVHEYVQPISAFSVNPLAGKL